MLVRRSGVQSVFQFIPKVFSGVEVRALCRTLEFFHFNLGARFVHRGIVMLEQTPERGWRMRSGGRRVDAGRYGNGMPARCGDVAQRRGRTGKRKEKNQQASEWRTDDAGIPLTHIPLQSEGAELGGGRAAFG
ncbi:hypothetical protein PDJAM_G00180000 [Pangasius djambal]|uniref:Uncharacterized protein n=1 Tax=Pangasius djambal TaxID=1691987 RepID=A0ACC5ZRI3_9TELE|nr:hypothetical protein [Pangasius djambal]